MNPQTYSWSLKLATGILGGNNLVGLNSYSVESALILDSVRIKLNYWTLSCQWKTE